MKTVQELIKAWGEFARLNKIKFKPIAPPPDAEPWQISSYKLKLSQYEKSRDPEDTDLINFLEQQGFDKNMVTRLVNKMPEKIEEPLKKDEPEKIEEPLKKDEPEKTEEEIRNLNKIKRLIRDGMDEKQRQELWRYLSNE